MGERQALGTGHPWASILTPPCRCCVTVSKSTFLISDGHDHLPDEDDQRWHAEVGQAALGPARIFSGTQGPAFVLIPMPAKCCSAHSGPDPSSGLRPHKHMHKPDAERLLGLPQSSVNTMPFAPVLLEAPSASHHLPTRPPSTSSSVMGSWFPWCLVRNFCHGWGVSSAGITFSHCL